MTKDDKQNKTKQNKTIVKLDMLFSVAVHTYIWHINQVKQQKFIVKMLFAKMSKAIDIFDIIQ